MPEILNFEDIAKEVKAIIADILEVAEEEIQEDVDFVEDLGADSLMGLEILATIERKYKVVIPETYLPQLRTFKDTMEVVQEVFNA